MIPEDLGIKVDEDFLKLQTDQSYGDLRFTLFDLEAVSEVIPLVKVMVDGNPGMADEITGWLDLDDKQSKWLKN